jgi:hypothetical protein
MPLLPSYVSQFEGLAKLDAEAWSARSFAPGSLLVLRGEYQHVMVSDHGNGVPINITTNI